MSRSRGLFLSAVLLAGLSSVADAYRCEDLVTQRGTSYCSVIDFSNFDIQCCWIPLYLPVIGGLVFLCLPCYCLCCCAGLAWIIFKKFFKKKDPKKKKKKVVDDDEGGASTNRVRGDDEAKSLVNGGADPSAPPAVTMHLRRPYSPAVQDEGREEEDAVTDLEEATQRRMLADAVVEELELEGGQGCSDRISRPSTSRILAQ